MSQIEQRQTKGVDKTIEEGHMQGLRDIVTVVIPTLNEADAVGPLIREVQACGYSNVLVVDGYSKDQTREIATKLGAQVVSQVGGGKAGAVLTARDIVRTPFFILMDGDYSYDPADLDHFLPLMEHYDHILGCRSLRNPNISKTHQIGNRILTSLFNTLFGSFIPDICTGMYLLRTSTARQIFLDRPGYVVDLEIAAQTLADHRVTFIPIGYRARMGKAKASTWGQGFRASFTVVSLARAYNPLLFISDLAAVATIPALIILAYTAFSDYVYGNFHLVLALVGVALLLIGGQGIIVATLSMQIRLLERKLTKRSNSQD
jgi:dolichol-phosphate mannosyltransferase